MPRTSIVSLLIACCALLLPRAAQAADVAVFAPEISNLSPQDQSTVGELIAQAYAIASQQSVVSPSYAQTTLTEARTYEAAAAKLAVKEYVRLSAVAAGKHIVVGASRYQADGKLVQQVKLEAENIESVSYTADAIARALLGQAPPAPMAPPIAAGYAPPPLVPGPPQKQASKKREDTTVYGVKAGVHLPFAKDASYYAGIGLQFDARLQFPRFFLEFGAGFIIPTVIDNSDDYGETCQFDQAAGQTVCVDSPKHANRGFLGGITTEIGASYYLTDGDVAPYIGGGLIPRVVLAGLDSSNNNHDIATMQAYAQFGITLPRSSTTRFLCDLRLAQSILPQHVRNGDVVWPTEPSLHVGVGW
jgi:opacity protein-like surface antigen